MPKSSKRKKEKAADFSKAKLRLGQGKKAPSNVVDTTFKARSIALPFQSIAQIAETTAPTTKRKLTLDDLIAHLKHYNPGTRKDALFGLRELLEEHPRLILPSLTAVLNACVRIIGDEDASVRKALLSLLSWLFPRISHEDLAPHAPVLLLFTTSAQTHIFPEIRIDAIRFLDLLLQHIPSVVVEGWARSSGGHGKRVLEGYLGILNAGTAFGEASDKNPPKATSTASVILSPSSKLVVLRALSTFLSTAIALQSSIKQRHDGKSSLHSTPTWFFASSFPSTSAFKAFDELISPLMNEPGRDSRNWAETFDSENTRENFVMVSECALDRLGDEFTIDNISDVGQMTVDGEFSSGGTAETAQLLHLARTLQPILISTLLDCAPAVFSPTTVPSETELQLVLSVAEIARELYGNVTPINHISSQSRTTLYEGVNAFLGRMAPYFPFNIDWPNNTRRDVKVEETFQLLNLIFCKLASVLMFTDVQDTSPFALMSGTSRSSSKQAAGKNNDIASVHLRHVREYVIAVLRGEASVSSGAQTTISRSVAPSTYVALLPTIWVLIKNEESQHPQNEQSVLIAVIEHALRTSSSSAVKRHTIEFLGRLLLLGSLAAVSEVEISKKLQEWLLHLPKTLWESGSNDLATAEVILRLLLRLMQRRSVLLTNLVLLSLRSRLAPYFMINHASRGRIPGPFNKLPPASPLRSLVLDVAFTTNPRAAEHDDLHLAISQTLVGDEKLYWTSLSTLSM